jgi:hypothetical protein
MARELSALGVEFDEIDVDSDPVLRDRYGRLVPVLADATGAEICHYHLDEDALRQAITRLGTTP